MHKQDNEGKAVPAPQGPLPREAVKTGKQKAEVAEAAEVSGRHRNSGQKDHKGAR